MYKTYQFRFTQNFLDCFNKLTEKNTQLKKRVKKALQLLIVNPHKTSLKSHKVISRNYGRCWSSTVTGDIRIIWDFAKDENIILLLDIGGHSGGKKVYK